MPNCSRESSGTNRLGAKAPHTTAGTAEPNTPLGSAATGSAMPHRPTWIVALCFAMFLAVAAPVAAQDRNPAGHERPPVEETEVRVAPIVIDGETLFSVRGITALPA